MSVKQLHELDQKYDVDLNPMDAKIIGELEEHGRITSSLIAKKFDTSRDYARQRIRRLQEHGVVIEVASRLYDLPENAAEYLDAEQFDN